MMVRERWGPSGQATMKRFASMRPKDVQFGAMNPVHAKGTGRSSSHGILPRSGSAPGVGRSAE